jgi:hypothetical protein
VSPLVDSALAVASALPLHVFTLHFERHWPFYHWDENGEHPGRPIAWEQPLSTAKLVPPPPQQPQARLAKVRCRGSQPAVSACTR